MTPAYVFDSHALLALFQREDGAKVVAAILRKAIQGDMLRLICVINIGEIIYLTKRRFGEQKKLEVLGHIQELGLTILPVSNELVYQAAEIKAEYPLSFADCFALACAINHSAVLVTGDPEFKAVCHLAPIEWVR